MRKVFVLILLAIYSYGFAQNFGEAVRYGQFTPGSTARTAGVAGAFGAMGGDFGSLSVNPAGIAQYFKSEFNFSSALTFQNSNAFLKSNGSASSLSRSGSSLSLDNIGLVIHKDPSSSVWKSSNIVIGFNKLADLNNKFEFKGAERASITERFIEKANGNAPEDLDEFEANAAFQSGAIFDSNKDNIYERDIDNSVLVNKNQFVTQEGNIHEMSIGWGGNIDNKLNLGATMGVPFISFEETKSYNETAEDDFLPIFNDLKYNEYLNTSGAGFNIKAGLVYKPIHEVRLGVAVHTPTWYLLNDDYSTFAAYRYTDTMVHSFEYTSPDGSFKYNLKTPVKVIGSAGTIFKVTEDLQGFINADVEWQDFGNSKYDFTEYSDNASEQQYTAEVNQDIDRYLGQTVNFRIGGELAFSKLRLRAGYESLQSPFNADSERQNRTAFGIGFRENSFFIDIAYTTFDQSKGYQPYSLIEKERDPVVNIQDTKNRIIMTIGFKF